MVSYIKLTPLSGAMDDGPSCYLLEFDEAKILLDCGWLDPFDVADLENLSKIASQVDATLLSHGDLEHLGGYAYAFSHLGLKCPVYATLPVHDLGMICMYDLCQMKNSVENFETFTYENINSAFHELTQLKYSQPVQLSGKCSGISITAYAAGHTIGGTIWKINKDTDNIVYAPEYNHKKERHLNKAALLTTDALSRPSVFITNAMNITSMQLPRKTIDQIFFNSIDQTLKKKGSILIPVTSSTRVIELLYMIEQHWAQNKYKYPFIFLSNHSKRLIAVTRTMLEWMSDSIAQEFSDNKQHPLEFSYLIKSKALADINKIQGPKLILTPLNNLSDGFSFDLLLKWSENPQNLILIPETTYIKSIAKNLYNEWLNSMDNPDPNGAPAMVQIDTVLDVTIKKKIPLTGRELTEYMSKNQFNPKTESEPMHLSTKTSRIKLDNDNSDDEDISDVENILTMSFDVYVKGSMENNRVFDQLPTYSTFPAVEIRHRIDDYGENVDFGLYSRNREMQYTEENLDDNVYLKDNLGLTGHAIEDKIPSKYKKTEEKLHITCNVLYLNLEGRSDGRSIKNIISQVSPRKLVLIRGTGESSMHLVEYFNESSSLEGQVLAPRVGECINISLVGNIYQLKITDNLISNLQTYNVDGYELSYIEGIVSLPRDGTTDAKRLSLHVETKLGPPTLYLEPLPINSRIIEDPKIVGELKLAEFCQKLKENNVPTEFTPSGELLINQKFIVSKNESGNLFFSGPIDPEYYKLRNLLYTHYAFLY